MNTLDLKVVPSEAVPPNAMIVIRGASPAMRFSEGRSFGAGVWIIPVSRIEGLKLFAPPDATGGCVLTLVLTSLEGAALAETKTVVIAAPPPAGDPEIKATAGFIDKRTLPSEITASPGVAPVTDAANSELQILMAKGRENLSLGNVLIARQFFQRAADKGLADAAMALASTYDARELARRGAKGVMPDPERARSWYEKAKELGSHEAAARLSEMSRR